jgi:hypothetical protein
MGGFATFVLGIFGGTVGATVVLGVLWKFLGTVWADRLRLQLELKNNEQLEKLKAELKTQADKTQQMLDAGLQKAILVTRTHFETEFNAYKEIYAALTEVRYSVEQTRPVWNFPSGESQEEKDKRRWADLQKAYSSLATAHNRLLMLKDNLAPFYAVEVYAALDECVQTSKLELFQLLTGGQQTFSTTWQISGYERQQEFKLAHAKVGELIRERIKSLGVLPQ